MPTDGTRAANVGTGDFGTSPIFVQLSDKPLLASTLLVGVSERKAQWRIENYVLIRFEWRGPVRAGLNKYCPNPCIDRSKRSLFALDVLCVRRECLGMDRQQ